MKKLIFTLTMILTFNLSNAQKITKFVDEMSEEVYWYDSGIILTTEDGERGIKLNWNFDSKSIDKPIVKSIGARVVGFSCLEDSKLIFLFEDGQKFTIKSWNKFNCDGNAWFNLSSEQKRLLSTVPLKKVQYTNVITINQ